ncbi:unnamed protein product [Malus baccata var. baccata]
MLHLHQWVPTHRNPTQFQPETLSISDIHIFRSDLRREREMARGKIQIRRIENSTNRQVTYSKRRNGLFKKANELTVLCDAEVSLIMVSSSGKVHEYISPSTTTKQLLDQYQKTLGIDIWSSHYEAMQQHLKKLKEVNMNLRRQIRQRVGDCLNDLSFDELCGLEEEVKAAVDVIRQRKVRMISNKIDTTKKKVKSQADVNMSLHELYAREGIHYE